ncbi:pseudaminic acid cytidylyltransferase [Shewanella vesiculosa]|nr:pseudaminic acid cytidylyltransferase [Shewanella vesiculosa]RPA50717.1 pseudaminic acid cytidylyltransferase [Shewanella vesiculosa]UJL44288.1 pseudaminic acid cytidylyltransferase [Shewanella vesiculosa]
MRIALIPARGGSKRIPRKNIKLFHGKPIIAYSIEAAIASGCFDKIIVSTDDAEIAKVAQQYGAEVPFMRPGSIADDYATTMDVIKHAIGWYKAHDVEVEALCCMYATAPFLTAELICAGYEALSIGSFQYAFSAAVYDYPIQRAFKLNANGSAEMLMPEYVNTRTQDLDTAYYDAAQFYWGLPDAFLTGLSMFSEHSYAVIIPSSHVQDIDTEDDWSKAERKYASLSSQS